MSSDFAARDALDDEPDTPEPGEEGFLEHHRDRIEELADSGAPDAWVFDRLRQSLDSEEDGTS